jgi:hypothetical protein
MRSLEDRAPLPSRYLDAYLFMSLADERNKLKIGADIPMNSARTVRSASERRLAY